MKHQDSPNAKPTMHASGLILVDAVTLVLICILWGPALALPVALWPMVTPALPGWVISLTLPLWPLLTLTCMIAIATLLRFCLPRPKAGSYALPAHPMAKVWLLHFCLQRAALPGGLSRWLFSFNLLRWATLRALGADAPLAMSASRDIDLSDATMVRFGDGAMLGMRTLISGHIIHADKLILGQTVVDDGAQVSANCSLGPGTQVGKNTVISFDCHFAQATLGDHVRVGVGCTMMPRVVVGNHAVIGHRVFLDTGVEVEAGAVVPDDTRLTPGSYYPATAPVKPSVVAAIPA